jgi:hypothetical protein
MVSDQGEWSLWADPSRAFRSPGLNCSGFLLSAARFLTGRNIAAESARLDFFGDSGPDSEWGEDWDFGLDVALNLAGWDSPIQPPAAGPAITVNAWGRKVGLGADIHGEDFPKLIESLPPGTMWFFAVSKPDRRFRGGVSYYHNGLLLVSEKSAWMYHATRRAGVHRVDLKNPQSLKTFRASFPPVKNHGERRILFAEARAAECAPAAPTGAP